MYRVTVALVAIVSTSFAQVVIDGSCPSVRVVRPFKGDRFKGSWYEWGRFSSQTESDSKCNVANYEFDEDNGSVQVTFVSTDTKGNKVSLKGSAILPEPVGQLNVTIPQLGSGTMDYSILGTDYGSWASLFVCKNLGNNQHQRYVWIVTRSTCPPAAAVISAKRAITGQGISTTPLQPVNQQNCQ